MGGALYGTTQFGGTMTHLCTSGCGTVFKSELRATKASCYRFKGQADGAYPTVALLSLQGTLYGTTEYGGAITRFCATGCGTIFKIGGTGGRKPSRLQIWQHRRRRVPLRLACQHRKRALRDDVGEEENMVIGAVFSANASSGDREMLHSFQCCQIVTDGSYPVAALTVVKGELYGTTLEGGNGNNGTVFVVTTAGVESLLYQFAGKPDGQAPQASLTLLDGRLYGTTANGGSASLGTVFTIAP